MTLQHLARQIVDDRRRSLALAASLIVSSRTPVRESNMVVPPIDIHVDVPEQAAPNTPPITVQPPAITVPPPIMPEVRVENVVDIPEVNVDVHVPKAPPATVNVTVPEQSTKVDVNLVVPPEAIKVDICLPVEQREPPTRAVITHADGTTSEVRLE